MRTTFRERALWMLDHPALASARLRTASARLADAQREVSQLMGAMENPGPSVQYFEAGLAEVTRRLMTAVKALDMKP